MFNAIKYINTKYKLESITILKQLEKYINSDQYEYNINYVGNFTDPIDNFYNNIK